VSHKQKCKRKESSGRKASLMNAIKKSKSNMPTKNKTQSSIKKNQSGSILRVACELKEKLTNKSSRLSTTITNKRKSLTPRSVIIYDNFTSESSEDDDSDLSFQNSYIFNSSLSSVSSLEFESFETSLLQATKVLNKSKKKAKRKSSKQNCRFEPPISSSKSNICSNSPAPFSILKEARANELKSALFNPIVTSSRRSLLSTDSSTREFSLQIENSSQKSNNVYNSTFKKNISNASINETNCSACNLIDFRQTNILSTLNCKPCCQTESCSSSNLSMTECSMINLKNNFSNNICCQNATKAQRNLNIQSKFAIDKNLFSENICSSTLLSRYHSDSKDSSHSSDSSLSYFTSSSSSLFSSYSFQTLKSIDQTNSEILTLLTAK
jgi:hypothetical protein